MEEWLWIAERGLVITGVNYQKPSEKKKSFVRRFRVGEFEIWRSIAQLDYHFFGKDVSIGGFCGREYARCKRKGTELAVL